MTELAAPPGIERARPDDGRRTAIAVRTEALFRSSGALRDGHFLLRSGKHSAQYLEKFQVIQYPEAVAELCAFFVEVTKGRAAQVDVVCGPTTGGVILAYETARQLDVRGIFAEEMRGSDGAVYREFRRGFKITPGETVLLVDDILTTGSSLLPMLPAIEAMGGRLVLASVLVDRSGGMSQMASPDSGRSYPVEALWTLNLPMVEPGSASCPECRMGLPIEAPGSLGTPQRT